MLSVVFVLFVFGLFKVMRLTQVRVPSWRLSAVLARLQEETRIEPGIMAETRVYQTVGGSLKYRSEQSLYFV